MVTQRNQFDAYLRELREALITMGQHVEKAVEQSVQSLQQSDMVLARKVIDHDREINNMETRIDDIGTSLIATQQPVAKDLRRIITAFRIASDLERIGDLAVDTAKVTVRIGNEGLIKPLIDIPKMAELVQNMTNECIHSYINEDVDTAFKLAQMDDEVDHLYSQILRDLINYINQDRKSANQVMLLSFVSHYLERMADHATNVGESVVYLVKGNRPDLND